MRGLAGHVQGSAPRLALRARHGDSTALDPVGVLAQFSHLPEGVGASDAAPAGRVHHANNHPPTTLERERDAAMTYAEADAAIKQRWRGVGSQHRVRQRPPKPWLSELSSETRLWLQDVGERSMTS